MKKLLLIPTTLIAGTIPVISLVGCSDQHGKVTFSTSGGYVSGTTATLSLNWTPSSHKLSFAPTSKWNFTCTGATVINIQWIETAKQVLITFADSVTSGINDGKLTFTYNDLTAKREEIEVTIGNIILEYDPSGPQYGNFTYEIDNYTATITGYKDTLPKQLLIPGYHWVDGWPYQVDVGDYAFYGADINSVTFEYGVGLIGSFAFAQCRTLSQINLPYTLSLIGVDAFESCAVKDVFIPQYVTNIMMNPWRNCDLDSISVDPQNPKYKAINNCLLNVESNIILAAANGFKIPTDTEFLLGVNCFSGLTKLKTLYIPKNVVSAQSDGSPVFNCPNLAKIEVEQGNEHFSTVDNGKGLLFKTRDGITRLITCLSESVPTDESITSIGSEAFAFNNKITDVVIPKNILSIWNEPFIGCNIETLTVDKDNPIFISPEESNVIMADATGEGQVWGICLGCKNSVIPDDEIKYPYITLGSYSFSHVDNLETITIPFNVMAIEPSAFALTGIKTIEYKGTKESWSFITHPNWHIVVPVDTTVTCSGDGEIIEYKAWE